MNIEILVDERNGQRFKASPTIGAKWYLTPIDEPLKKPERESNVVEKLAQVRRQLADTRNRFETIEFDYKIEKAKVKILKSALRIRQIYVECPDCRKNIEAGNKHSCTCRHAQAESIAELY